MFAPDELVAESKNLHRFALRLTKNAGDAEDLLQSTLLRAIERKHQFEPGTNLFSWASRIMFNLFATGHRRRRKFESPHDPEPHMERLSCAPSQETAVDLMQVAQCMKQLSAEHRRILVMVCVQDMRYEDVSEMLRIPVGTVRSRLSRARRQLQNLLETSGRPLRDRSPGLRVQAPARPGVWPAVPLGRINNSRPYGNQTIKSAEKGFEKISSNG